MCAKRSITTILDTEDLGFLNNTCSPSFADSKRISEYGRSEEIYADPFEKLDGGLRNNIFKQAIIEVKKTKIVKLKKVQENVISPLAKKSRLIDLSEIEEPPASPSQISDQTASFSINEDFSYDVKESSLLKDFWWESNDEKQRSSIIFNNVDMFESYHILRKRSQITVPHIFRARKEVGCRKPATNILFEPHQIDKNCSVHDRRKTILDIFSRRRSLRLSEDTIHLGIGLLDKCLDLFLVYPESITDLAAINLVIASKVEEVNFLTLKDISSCDIVKEKSIKMLRKLEQMVLKMLSFEVTFPTPITFANYLLVILRAGSSKINMTHYLLELALLAISTRWYSSDTVAHAATCLAFAIDTNMAVNSIKELYEAEKNLVEFARVKPEKSRPVMKILIKQFLQASHDLHEIYMEYERAGRDSVALRSVCRDLEHFIMDS